MNDQITDTELIDWIADERLIEIINGVDIDESAFDAYHKAGGDPDDEEAWKAEWRKQFRIAIAKGVMKS